MAALQLVGIAGYSFSLRLALHPHNRTLCPVQLRVLGSINRFQHLDPIPNPDRASSARDQVLAEGDALRAAS